MTRVRPSFWFATVAYPDRICDPRDTGLTKPGRGGTATPSLFQFRSG
jgi:hypothetical protein